MHNYTCMQLEIVTALKNLSSFNSLHYSYLLIFKDVKCHDSQNFPSEKIFVEHGSQ